jgi:O-methyltransferase domain
MLWNREGSNFKVLFITMIFRASTLTTTHQAHDFFEAQPQKTASIFLLKQIMHDWSDAYCAKILTRLRASAMPSTKLLLLDSIMPFTCHDPSADNDSGIPGAVPKEAPAPLLANFGAVSEMIYCADSTVNHSDAST